MMRQVINNDMHLEAKGPEMSECQVMDFKINSINQNIFQGNE